jgi:hypothetical protein
MMIDPTALSKTDEQHLVEIAEKSGDETLCEAVSAFLERSAKKSEPNGTSSTEQARPIWEEIAEIIKDVPEEEFRKLPCDGAEQLDHYIYGTPKRSK